MKIFISPAVFLLLNGTVAQLNEWERQEEYKRRGHTWPPKLEDFSPPTEGWRKIYARRFKQLEYVDDPKRYQAYMHATYSGLISKNFTEYGFGVTRAPQAVIDKLKKRLHIGLASEEIKKEKKIACVETDTQPYFFADVAMNDEIMNELLPLHEAWSGVELVPNNAYGLRAYRNGTNLLMHVDKTETHIISSILHVDHGENDDPWPLFIEGFDGNFHEVYLESGDMLFYESSKCLHGRPKTFNGEFYSSLFTHYYPKDWDYPKISLDTHYRIPPIDIWDNPKPKPPDETVEDLTLIETSYKELQCPNSWCGTVNALKHYGPAPGYGKVMTPGGIVELKNIPTEESFNLENKKTIEAEFDSSWYYEESNSYGQDEKKYDRKEEL